MVEPPQQRLLDAIVDTGVVVGTAVYVTEEYLAFPERELDTGELTFMSLHGLPRLLPLLANSSEFTHLPPLFGSEQGLPMADMYVELAITVSRPNPAPWLLGTPDALATAQEERNRLHQARRQNVNEALGTGQHSHVGILGAPGSGKTSLLKRATALIAAGHWPGWILPLYIPLRRYWETRRNAANATKLANPEMSLLRFAAARIIEMNHYPEGAQFVSGVAVIPHVAQHLQTEIDEVMSLLTYLSGAQRKHVIFLLDGLDEVASDPAAVAVLSEEIRQLGHGFAWVLTSRRAGFFGGLEERIRFEVVSLDNTGIDQLVHNWFTHQLDARSREHGAQRVLTQIMHNPRLLAMARNPFLLTLLCHLHGEGDLPLYRSQVYERIFKLARQQLCLREKDPTLFGPGELDFLAHFCRHLYTDATRAPRHLFDRDDWLRFALPASAPDLAKHFLNSRLLNQWGDVGDYHLAHLTLHEYLIARALAEKNVSVSEAIAHLHQPHWRMVLRFLAGCYRDTGRMADLASLLKAMLTPVDLNGLMYLEAAQLLLEARIEDSRALLGYDLREKLWQLWHETPTPVASVAGQAVAMLAPELTLKRIHSLLGEVQGPFQIGVHNTPHDAAGNRALKAITLLAEVPGEPALRLLVNLLFDEARPQLADAARTAWVQHNRPVVHQAVLARAASLGAGSPGFARLCHLAGTMRHRNFAPWLLAQLDQAMPDAATMADLSIACALVGGAALFRALLLRAQAAPDLLDMWSSEIWDAVCSGSADWRAWIAATAIDTKRVSRTESARQRAMIATAIRHRLLDDAATLALLQSAKGEALSDYVEAIGDGALANRPTAASVEQALVGLLAQRAARRGAVFSLAILDEQRIGRGAAAHHTQRLMQRIKDSDSEVRELVVEALGLAKEYSAQPRIVALMQSQQERLSVRVAAIQSLAQLASDNEEHIAAQIEAMLQGPLPELVLEAALALARIAPVRLGSHLHIHTVRLALAHAGAELGLMFFDTGYVNASGARHAWGQPTASPLAPSAKPAPPIFISYNSKDRAQVSAVVGALNAAGIAVSWNIDDLPRAGRWQDELFVNIR